MNLNRPIDPGAQRETALTRHWQEIGYGRSENGRQIDRLHGDVLSHVFPGAIVLMHDSGGDRGQSVAALEIILRELSAKRY
jgi:peptidoglycan/xylan/chitin deacetylase (PgdA/CDA1 family)